MSSLAGAEVGFDVIATPPWRFLGFTSFSGDSDSSDPLITRSWNSSTSSSRTAAAGDALEEIPVGVDENELEVAGEEVVAAGEEGRKVPGNEVVLRANHEAPLKTSRQLLPLLRRWSEGAL